MTTRNPIKCIVVLLVIGSGPDEEIRLRDDTLDVAHGSALLISC
jgi:hypothetical protein